MPWCAGCDRFLNPNTLRNDGTCPACEARVADPPELAADGADPAEQVTSLTPGVGLDVPKAPWHFKLLVVATVVYLGWRLVELIGWAIA